jgi:hypothetical protein
MQEGTRKKDSYGRPHVNLGAIVKSTIHRRLAMNLKPILAAVVIAFPASALAQQAPPTTPPALRTDNGDKSKAEADKAKAAHLYRQAEHQKELAKVQWEVANELWHIRQESLDEYHHYLHSSPPPQRPQRPGR